MHKALDQEPKRQLADASAHPLADEPPARAGTAAPDVLPADASSASSGGVAAPPPHPRSLLDVFSATLLRCGDRVAIDAPGRALTYVELSRLAEELAGRLRAAGIGLGDRVGVRVASGSSELYVAILGVLMAGAAYVPVDADDPAERAEELWRRAKACAVVEDGLTIEQLA